MAITTLDCIACHKGVEIDIDPDGYRAWVNGMLIQKALPKLTADEREFILSGFCNECYDIIFCEEETF